MRRLPPEELERGRVLTGSFATKRETGMRGMFRVPGPCGDDLQILSTPGPDWELASVSLEGRCPNWAEMDFVKELLWSDDEAVFQVHAPRSQYANFNPHCLQLWRAVGVRIPFPPSVQAGPKRSPS